MGVLTSQHHQREICLRNTCNCMIDETNENERTYLSTNIRFCHIMPSNFSHLIKLINDFTALKNCELLHICLSFLGYIFTDMVPEFFVLRFAIHFLAYGLDFKSIWIQHYHKSAHRFHFRYHPEPCVITRREKRGTRLTKRSIIKRPIFFSYSWSSLS